MNSRNFENIYIVFQIYYLILTICSFAISLVKYKAICFHIHDHTSENFQFRLNLFTSKKICSETKFRNRNMLWALALSDMDCQDQRWCDDNDCKRLLTSVF